MTGYKDAEILRRNCRFLLNLNRYQSALKDVRAAV